MTAATRTGPSVPTAAVALYRLFLRGQLTRLRAFGLLGLGAVAILLEVVTRGADDRVDAATTVMAEYGLGVVAPVCTLWIATSLVGDLSEDRLLAYLWLKPIARWILPAAAIAATLTIMMPLVVVPLTVAAIASGVGDLVIPTVLASTAAVAAYSGIFVTLGTRFSRALWWGLLYILVWENAIARIADGTAQLAVRSYASSILARATDVDISLADRSPVSSIIVPMVLCLGAVAVSAWLLAHRDVD